MRKYAFIACCIFLSMQSWCQDSAHIKGIVREKDNALASATVSLLRAKDSSLVKLALSGKDGHYEFNGIKTGSYLVSVTSIGYANYFSTPFDLKQDFEVPAITMTPAAKDLGGVVVQSRKPMVEAKLDKMVVNVDASPSNAANTALELLEKSPGISVDRDGNISLKGKQGVIVLMDGKQTYLSGQELADLLRGMPASELEQVEIMTQPSSKYDAAGNAGVINLKRKKSRQMGMNGSVSVSYVQGVYPKSPNSFNFNYRKGKVNIFTNGGFTYWQQFNNQVLTRRYNQSAVPTYFDQTGTNHNKSYNYNLRVGLDYAIDKKTNIGFTVGGVSSLRKGHNRSRGDFYKEGSTAVDSSVLAQNIARNDWKNFTSNVNFRRTLDGNGREITADLDYISYTSDLSQYTINRVAYPGGNGSEYLLRANLPSDIRIYSGKVDYIHPLSKDTKIEAGIKSSLVKTDNNAPYETWDPYQDKWVDDVRKDHFAYDEQISAAYVSFNKQVKKWGFQAGLRGEYTKLKGTQVLIGKSISRDYFQLFPTAYISFGLNDKNQFGLSYGRRIERPNYQDLNPFQRFLDLYTYNKGNPYLSPQFTNNIELSHIFSGKLSTTINFTSTTDIINDILKQDDQTKVTYQTKENVASRRNVGLAVSYNAPLTKWWTTSLYGNVFNNYYKGVVNNVMLSTDVTSFIFNVNQQFKFAKTWGAEVSGFYQSRQLTTSVFVIDPIYAINFGASKQILKNKGTIRLSVIDPFQLQKVDVHIDHGNIDMTVLNTWDNRRVGLTFTYRFSKGQAVQQRKRSSGSAQDEQNRIGAGNQ